MGKRLSSIASSNFIFALKIHIIVCIISLFAILLFNSINSLAVTIIAACLYLVSGILLSQRKSSLLSLFSILLFIYLLGILDLLAMFLLQSFNGVLTLVTNFIYLVFSDPLQILNALPNNPILGMTFSVLLPFFPILLLHIGKNVLGNTGLATKFDNMRGNLGIHRKILYGILIIVLLINAYNIYNPDIYVEYNNSVGFEGFEEAIVIDNDGSYNYIKTNYYSNAKKEIKLKLTKEELRKLAFSIVYGNMFFNLKPDLSVYNKTDQASKAIKVKWFGRTKVVHGYGIENYFFYNIASNLKNKIDSYYRDYYKYGYIDKSGKFSINPKYNYANSFSGYYAYVNENGNNYWINKSGIAVPESETIYSSKSSANLAAKMQYGDYGFINDEGKFIIEPKYHLAQDFSEGLAVVWDENNDLVYIDEKEQKIIRIDFAQTGNSSMSIMDLSGFHDGLAWIKWNNKYGYIDKNGQMAISSVFDAATDFSEGLACVNVNNKWGYIDRIGRYVIDPKFDMAFPFSDGLGCVRIGDEENGKWGYIDKTGKFIIDAKFSNAQPFINGLACVLIDLTEGEIGNDSKYKLKK